MKKRRVFLCLCLFGILSIGVSTVWISKNFQKTSHKKPEHIKYTYGNYFFPIAITKYTPANQPCLVIQIDHSPISAMLDLGFAGQLGFPSQFIEKIEDKKYLQSKKMYGIRGGEFEDKLYEVPIIKIGPLSFFHPILHEDDEKFYTEADIIKTEKTSSKQFGRIGWKLFKNTNLFLNIADSKVAFCDSLNTLKQQGFATETFAKAPLLLERGLVEFYVETPKGPLRCALDTGTTWNLLNTDFEKEIPLDKIVLDSNNLTEYSSFLINGKDFGPIKLHKFPIKVPIHIEAILGMEFFRDHLVFIDFDENAIYFAKK